MEQSSALGLSESIMMRRIEIFARYQERFAVGAEGAEEQKWALVG